MQVYLKCTKQRCQRRRSADLLKQLLLMTLHWIHCPFYHKYDIHQWIGIYLIMYYIYQTHVTLLLRPFAHIISRLVFFFYSLLCSITCQLTIHSYHSHVYPLSSNSTISCLVSTSSSLHMHTNHSFCVIIIYNLGNGGRFLYFYTIMCRQHS